MDWGDKNTLVQLASRRVLAPAEGQDAFEGKWWCRDCYPEFVTDYTWNFIAGNIVVDFTGLDISHFYGPVGAYPIYMPTATWACQDWNAGNWPVSSVVTLTRTPAALFVPARWEYVWDDGSGNSMKIYLMDAAFYQGGGYYHAHCYGLWVYLENANGYGGCAWGGVKSGTTPLGDYVVACTDVGTPVGPSARVSPNIWAYYFVGAGYYGGVSPPAGPQAVPCGCADIDTMLQYTAVAA